MEILIKLLVDFVKTTKAFWLVLLGAGIAIFTHYKTSKYAMDREIQERKSKQYQESNKDKIEALKQLYELVHEITSIYTIYMTKVKYKISNKQRGPLSDDVEELRIFIVENISKASMLVQFYAIEKNVTFNHFQQSISKGLGIWDTYQLVNIKGKKGKKDKDYLERLSKAYLELINKNAIKLSKYEFALTFRIGSQGRKILRSNDLYIDGLDRINFS